MRPVRYNVAASLDGFVAGPNGEFDWIPSDPTVDFAAIFGKVDTILLGRKTYEAAQAMGGGMWGKDARVLVFSRSMRPADHPRLTIVGDDAAARVEALRKEEGDGEIWLFGGGDLFRSLLAAGQVDRVEVTVVPVILGGGIPLIAPGAPQTSLRLEKSHQYPSGMVSLVYSTAVETAPKPRRGRTRQRP